MSLKEVRKRRGWTQKQLAKQAGYHVNYIMDIERGNRPRYDRALHLAVILDVPTIEIMGAFK